MGHAITADMTSEADCDRMVNETLERFGRIDLLVNAVIVSRIPLGRVAETDDLVGPAIFLCSGAASFVTGQIPGIDGGLTATQ